jgi:hypothetical protein
MTGRWFPKKLVLKYTFQSPCSKNRSPLQKLEKNSNALNRVSTSFLLPKVPVLPLKKLCVPFCSIPLRYTH